MNNYLKAIGIEGIIKGSIVFFLYGFFVLLFIHCVYGLEGELPDAVNDTFSGPLSIYTFSILALVGLVWLFLVTTFWPKKLDLEISRPKRIFWFPLPICEAAIAMGVIIGMCLLGVSSMGWILFSLELTNVNIHTMFFVLSVAMFLFTFPVIYFTLLMLDIDNKISTQLNIGVVFYSVIVAVLMFVGLPRKDLILSGVLGASIMIASYAYRRYLKGNDSIG